MSAPHNLSNTLQKFDLGNGKQGQFYSLPALEKAGIVRSQNCRSPIRIVLESVLRNCDGLKVQEANVKELANWKPTEERTAEIPFVVARIVLQDFTGVPLLVDLAAMRSAVAKMGKNPKIIETAGARGLGGGSLGAGGFRRARPIPWRAIWTWNFPATASVINFSSGACRRSTRLRSCAGIGIVHQVNWNISPKAS